MLLFYLKGLDSYFKMFKNMLSTQKVEGLKKRLKFSGKKYKIHIKHIYLKII